MTDKVYDQREDLYEAQRFRRAMSEKRRSAPKSTLPDRAWLIPSPEGRGTWYDADVGGDCEEYIRKGSL